MRSLLLLLILLTGTLQGAYTYSMIVVGSYTEKVSAIKGKAWFEERFWQDEDYQAIRYDIQPQLYLTKGEKYYSLSLRPFESDAEAMQLLPVVRRYRPDAFIATFEQTEKVDFTPAALKGQNVVKEYPADEGLASGEREPLLYLAAGLIVVLLILMLLMYRRNRALIRENWDLESGSGALRASVELKEAFFNRLEEEIKGPLNIMMGYTHVLSGTALDEKQSTYVGKIRATIDLLATALNDMHELARINKGEFDISDKPFNLNAVLNNLSTMLGPVAMQKGVELVFKVDNKVPATLIGDAQHLDEVLRNLIRFSLQHTDHGSVVMHISRQASSDKFLSLLLEISDTSGGLEPEELAQLFDMKLESCQHEEREHKEWGLLIANKIVDAMNGTLVASSAAGKGVTFSLRIDLGIPEDFEKRQYRLPSKSSMYKKVLIADGNLQAATSLDRMVSYFHHTAEIVANLDNVVNRLQENSYDIIYIDSKLVQQDRKGTIHVIKQNSDAKIVLVGNEAQHAIALGAEGADLQMKKPFNHQDVFDTIVELYADEVETNEGVKVYSKADLKTFAGSTILMAEDNDVNQRIVKNLLEGTGIRLITALNGKEAIEQLLAAGHVDLIIMDIDMPVMDGYEAARRIRGDERYRTIPILALTAQIKPEDVERAKSAGMQEHLGKPYKMVALYNALYKYLMMSTQLPTQKKRT